jgi:hypothetical protein
MIFLSSAVVIVVDVLWAVLPGVDLAVGPTVLLAPLGAAVATIFWNEWSCYKLAHLWLVITDRLPWGFTEFLDDCQRLGLLRKDGNHFEFRHRRLRASLAGTVGGGSRTTVGSRE